MQKRLMLAVLWMSFFCVKAVDADLPLPKHQIEGNSGVFITPTAYLTNPPAEGKSLGLPSVSVTGAFIGEKDAQSYVVTENILGRFEVGYALERMGLGDWPDEVFQTTGLRTRDYVLMHNLNVRSMIVKEGEFDCSWMPALTLGTHLKWNDGRDDINRDLGGECDFLGADHDFGAEFSAIASKTITGVLPNPMILSGGIRNGDAIHTGFLGFAGERRCTFEGSLIYFLTDNLLIASEYRQKSNLADECTINGNHLVRAENDWWDICLAYIINDHLSIAGGYANFGNVLNHHEDNVWAFQLKYEF